MKLNSLISIVITMIFVACGLSACHENRFSFLSEPSEDSLPVKIGDGLVSHEKIDRKLDSIVNVSNSSLIGVKTLNCHYKNSHHLLWFSPDDGLNLDADSLMEYVEKVKELQMPVKHFLRSGLKDNLKKLESLQLEGVDTARLIAEVDYGLSRTFIKLYSVLHYGAVNPYKIFNNLDNDPHDSLKQKFRTLYDVRTRLVDSKTVHRMMQLIDNDSVAEALQKAEPQSTLYKTLKRMLPDAKGVELKRIQVNMERLRWQQDIRPEVEKRYVLVNIPSLILQAFNDGHVEKEMKIVCGSGKTKTPLLNSRIMRMDLNPRWNIPVSIIRHEIALHAQDSAYFARNHYYIRDKQGKHLNPMYVTEAALKTGLYRVTQEGGEGNALGRLIFRFKNNFSIFLHDTSSKGAFSRDDRRISHGCIRVEKPLELAEFLLADKLKQNVTDTLAIGLKSHSYAVKPDVPLFITYMTMWLSPDGKMNTYSDIYGYDDVLYEALKPSLVTSKQ